MLDSPQGLTEAVQTLIEQHPATVYVTLFGAAALEYVFPPFPGDTVTLAGAVLVSAFGWSFVPVFLAVTGGSVLGAAADFWLGLWIGTRWAAREGAQKRALGRVLQGFRRYGDAYLLINRFLPGARALFFVAAGMVGMPFGRVVLFATLSAVAWNVLLMAVGWWIGSNLDALEGILRNYAVGAVIAFALLVGALLLRAWLTRDRTDPPPPA